METLVLSDNNFDEVVNKAALVLKAGGTIIAPTDTVYGLLGNATDKGAIEKVYKIKDRPMDKPLPLFVKDISMAEEFARVSKEQKEFLEHNWPGKITVVLKRNPRENLFGVDKDTVALRIPKYQFINDLLAKTGVPLSGTSANISHQPASTKIEEILEQFANSETLPDLVINAGDLEMSQPSTIIDLTSPEQRILR